MEANGGRGKPESEAVSNSLENSVAAASNSTTGCYQQAKERLQRFDLVIQHLHRLRATLALDSSVRELQKLQTLNILGQTLMPHSAPVPRNASVPPLPLLPPVPPIPPPHPSAGGSPVPHPNFLSLRPPIPPGNRMPEPFFANGESKMIQPVKTR